MARQHVRPHRNHVQRIAQLVRQDRDEVVLHPVQPLHGGARGLFALDSLALALEVDVVGDVRHHGHLDAGFQHRRDAPLQVHGLAMGILQRELPCQPLSCAWPVASATVAPSRGAKAATGWPSSSTRGA
jgi:hypothetical protein